jgi:DNA-binding transcriptional LysR family regulator
MSTKRLILSYESFYFAAKYHGFKSAALHMPYGLTPSALYNAVRKLQQHLGQQLYVAAGSSFTLTPAGEKIFAWCRLFFDQRERIEAEVRAGNGHASAPPAEVKARNDPDRARGF